MLQLLYRKEIMQLRPHQTEALQAMADNDLGQVIVPTGGGKTMCMIHDVIREITDRDYEQTIVVVAPRILLAEQLCREFIEILDINFSTSISYIHVHSGKVDGMFNTTKPFEIQEFVESCTGHKMMFTTYHSLHRIQESGVDVDTIYFDEAHNSVQKNFFPATDYFSKKADRCYFFTATPKHSRTTEKAGMNHTKTYGNVICQIPAPRLVKQGYILPPKVEVYRSRILKKDELVADRDNEQMVEAIDNLDKDKVLICAKSTRQIVALVSQTDFVKQLAIRGYSYMYITSKTGAVIDGEKVDRESFFDTLNEWGRTDKKFVVLHHSILSEGINVNGLEAVLFMRNMDYIGISQTIGRVIRKGAEDKVFGLVCVPVYSNVGITTARKVEAVVDTIFNKGEAATTVITR